MEAGGPFPVIEKDFINPVESKTTDFGFGVMTFKSTGTIRTDAKINRVLSVLPTAFQRSMNLAIESHLLCIGRRSARVVEMPFCDSELLCL